MTTEAIVFYGNFFTNRSLLIASLSFKKVLPSLIAIDLIRLRRRQGTLAINTSAQHIMEVPDEIWQLIQGALVPLGSEFIEVAEQKIEELMSPEIDYFDSDEVVIESYCHECCSDCLETTVKLLCLGGRKGKRCRGDLKRLLSFYKLDFVAAVCSDTTLYMKHYEGTDTTPVAIGMRSSKSLPGEMGTAFNEAIFALTAAEISSLELKTPATTTAALKQLRSDYNLEALPPQEVHVAFGYSENAAAYWSRIRWYKWTDELETTAEG